MLNETQKKMAARRLCELRGDDPDRIVYHGVDLTPSMQGMIPDVCLCSLLWTRALREIDHACMIQEAVNYGHNFDKPTVWRTKP